MVAHNEYPIQVKYDSGHCLLADILGYELNMNKFKAQRFELFSNNNSFVKNVRWFSYLTYIWFNLKLIQVIAFSVMIIHK